MTGSEIANPFLVGETAAGSTPRLDDVQPSASGVIIEEHDLPRPVVREAPAAGAASVPGLARERPLAVSARRAWSALGGRWLTVVVLAAVALVILALAASALGGRAPDPRVRSLRAQNAWLERELASAQTANAALRAQLQRAQWSLQEAQRHAQPTNAKRR